MKGYPANRSPLELQSVASWLLYGVGAGLCWWKCAQFCLAIGEAVGWPVTFGVFGVFGVPILGVLGNGWRAK
jgi:hypothetical protein